MIILEKLILTSEYVQANPGLSLRNNGQVDTLLASGCKHGAPGIFYGPDVDVQQINKEGIFTTSRVFIYGNATNQLAIKSLDMKNHSKVVLMNT